MHPLDAFKKARQRALLEADAENIARRQGLIDDFRARMVADVGEDVAAHVSVELKTEKPQPTFRLCAADHIPITATIEGEALAFTLSRRGKRKTFAHLADALMFGEPYPLPKASPPAEADFDTTPTDEPPTK